ncbi:MAG: Ig-like domain-containing protein [Prevotella sp.]|nr:Ig-like domain-containing protein [Prevotella sp.]
MKKIFTLLTLLMFIGGGKTWADEAITVTWLPDGSSASVTSTAGTASVDDILTVANITASSDIKEGPISKNYTTGGTHYYGYYTPTTATGTAGVYSKDDYLTFAVTVKEGYTFTPTSVTLQAIGIGTSNQGAQIFATVQTANGTNQLGKGDSSNQNPTTLTLNSFLSESYAAGETLYFYVHFGSKDDNKSVGFRDVVLSGTYAVADTRDPLTLSFTPDNQNIAVGGTLSTAFSILTDISSESAKYSSVTYSSNDEAIATVNSSGVVTGVAAGTTTIKATVTATADATYKTTTTSITVNVITAQTKDSHMVTPSSTLDLTDASAASALLNGSWDENYGHPLFGNDGSNNYMVYPLVAAYSSAGDTKQAWIGNYGLGSSNESWDATGVFVGSTAYNMNTAKRANLGSNKVLSFRVKGVKKAQLLADTRGTSKKIYMSAYEVTAGTPASTTIVYESLSTNSVKETLTLNLDAAKEYVLALTSANDSRLYEMALFYDESVGLENVPIGATGYATYSTDQALDFTGLEIEAYQVTGANGAGTAVVKEKITGTVAENTGLLVKGTAGKSYVVPVVASGTDYSATNKMKPNVTASTITAGTGGDVNYVLMNNGGTAEFQWIGSTDANLGANKAYLTLADGPKPGSSARGLSIDGEVTGIKNIKVGTEDNVYYDLNGRRVLYPTKGLYIVNGKKVVLK